MELYKPTATLFLDNRKEKANGKYPLKLTIYHRPEKRRYSTGIDLTSSDWQKLGGKRLKDDDLREIKIKANAILSKAEKVFEKCTPFSFSAFESIFFDTPIGQIDLSLEYWFKEYSQILDAQGREGTRISYNTTYNSFNSFKRNLKLPDITKQFLQDYEQHMTLLGKSSSTVGIYLRQLRAIINRAIEKGIMKQESYPFRNFEIPAARNIKKALNDEQLQLLLNYAPKDVYHSKALDFWVLSYLANGMNFTDILHLTSENINGNFLYFFRQKTKRTKKKDLRPIKVALNPRAKELIRRWQTNDPHNPFIFPVLEAGLTPKTTKHRIQKFIKQVNEAMDDIRIDLGFENKVGTYVARHSFSSRLMRTGASTQFIKECLGHSSATVSESYLGDFADNVVEKYAILLTDFSQNAPLSDQMPAKTS